MDMQSDLPGQPPPVRSRPYGYARTHRHEGRKDRRCSSRPCERRRVRQRSAVLPLRIIRATCGPSFSRMFLRSNIAGLRLCPRC
jgi:hypothetical protein